MFIRMIIVSWLMLRVSHMLSYRIRYENRDGASDNRFRKVQLLPELKCKVMK